MARTSQTLTQAEVDAFNRGCVKHNIDNNDTAFGSLIGEYIAITWGQDITDQSFDIALQKLQEAGHSIPFKSQAQVRWEKQAAQYPQQAEALISFLQQQRIGLVNTGDELFANASALLPQLVGREITNATVLAAQGRAQYAGKQLYFVPGPEAEADRSVVGGRKNHAVTEKPHAPGVMFTKDELSASPLDARRHAPDPQRPQPEPVLDSTEARWKDMAQKLLLTGNSHGEKHELQEAFNNQNGRSWRRVFEDMDAIKKTRQRRSAVGW